MGAWNVNRARAVLALANLIVVAGFAAVLPLVVTTFVPGTSAMPLFPQMPQIAQIPQIPYLQPGVAMPTLLALAGLIVMFIGSSIASRQRYRLDAYRHRREDAQRRVYAYRIDERIEPSLEPRGKHQQA